MTRREATAALECNYFYTPWLPAASIRAAADAKPRQVDKAAPLRMLEFSSHYC